MYNKNIRYGTRQRCVKGASKIRAMVPLKCDFFFLNAATFRDSFGVSVAKHVQIILKSLNGTI